MKIKKVIEKIHVLTLSNQCVVAKLYLLIMSLTRYCNILIYCTIGRIDLLYIVYLEIHLIFMLFIWRYHTFTFTHMLSTEDCTEIVMLSTVHSVCCIDAIY